jgi:hypothetical protein
MSAISKRISGWTRLNTFVTSRRDVRERAVHAALVDRVGSAG